MNREAELEILIKQVSNEIVEKQRQLQQLHRELHILREGSQDNKQLLEE